MWNHWIVLTGDHNVSTFVNVEPLDIFYQTRASPRLKAKHGNCYVIVLQELTQWLSSTAIWGVWRKCPHNDWKAIELCGSVFYSRVASQAVMKDVWILLRTALSMRDSNTTSSMNQYQAVCDPTSNLEAGPQTAMFYGGFFVLFFFYCYWIPVTVFLTCFCVFALGSLLVCVCLCATLITIQ